MSVTRRIAFGVAASWLSRGITILLGLILLPVLFRHLPREELGVWLLLGQSWLRWGSSILVLASPSRGGLRWRKEKAVAIRMRH